MPAMLEILKPEPDFNFAHRSALFHAWQRFVCSKNTILSVRDENGSKLPILSGNSHIRFGSSVNKTTFILVDTLNVEMLIEILFMNRYVSFN